MGRVVWEMLARADTGRTLGAVVLVPSGWIVIEALRSWSSLGGPWGLLGASQWNFAPTLAPAALGGVWLVSFLVVAANVAIVAAISRARTVRVRAVCAGVVVLAVAVGPAWNLVRPGQSASPAVRLAIVQPGVVDGRTARFDAGEELTAS